MSNVNLTISPVVNSVTVSPVTPTVTISGVTSIPTGSAGGDLAGSYPNPTVDGLRGRTVAATAPTAGQALVWNDSLQQWEPGSASGGVSDGDKGDIFVSGSGATWTIDTDAVTDDKLRESAALSVIGRSANSTGNPADIAAATDGHVLRRSGTSLGFGQVATAGIADDAVTLAKIENIANARLLGNSSGVTQSPNEISVTSPLSINTSINALEFIAPGSDGQVYYRASGALTTSAAFAFNAGTATATLATGGDSVAVGPTGMTAPQSFSINTGVNPLYLGDVLVAGNGTSVTIDDSADTVSVTATTLDATGVDVKANRLTFTPNGEFIRNDTNGRIDFLPAPLTGNVNGIYFDLTTSAFYTQIGTINSSGGLNTNSGVQFLNNVGIAAGKTADFGNSGGFISYYSSGTGTKGTWYLAPFIDGTNNAGSVALVSQNGQGNSNRRPSTAHANPTLYVYAFGTASANDFVRISHDTTDGTIEAGDGKLIAKAATRVRIEGSAGGFDLPTGDGTSGQVLTTNGSGDVSWATPSGGGGISIDEAKRVAYIGI
jgi:hypothetical protein